MFFKYIITRSYIAFLSSFPPPFFRLQSSSVRGAWIGFPASGWYLPFPHHLPSPRECVRQLHRPLHGWRKRKENAKRKRERKKRERKKERDRISFGTSHHSHPLFSPFPRLSLFSLPHSLTYTLSCLFFSSLSSSLRVKSKSRNVYALDASTAARVETKGKGKGKNILDALPYEEEALAPDSEEEEDNYFSDED